MSMNNLLTRVILPVLSRCARCGASKGKAHLKADHAYVRDPRLPQWHGWHAARRGLGSNLYRFGVPPMVIQRILHHSNVSTTANYYIKTAADDVRDAMATPSGHQHLFRVPCRNRSTDDGIGVMLEPTIGLEPMTCRLRIGCSTN